MANIFFTPFGFKMVHFAEEACTFAETKNMLFIETSALDSTNVIAAFEKAITKIYQNVKTSKRESFKTAVTGTKRGSVIQLDNPQGSQNNQAKSNSEKSRVSCNCNF